MASNGTDKIMGMYTELVMAVEISKDIPQKVKDVLVYLTNPDRLYESLPGVFSKCPVNLPDHQLFSTDRWAYMLQCGSYYFLGDTHSTFRFDNISQTYFLTIRTNFKNYDDEINLFLNWIEPYCIPRRVKKDGTYFVGYSQYEERRDPTLIYFKSFGKNDE